MDSIIDGLMAAHPDERMTAPYLKLEGEFLLRSPLSHISEAVSTVAYLVQDPIVQPEGSVVEVGCYNGNAFRGQMRDLMARRVADAVGGGLTINPFHFLFSGGRHDKQEDSLDLAAARALRSAIPMVAILGGGIGSQILGGRMRVMGSYPICQEAIPVLPERLHGDAARVSYKALTFEKEFSRRDDAKFGDGERFMAPVNAPRRLNAKGKVPSDQMRMTSELVAPGTRLHAEMHLNHVSALEVGCLVQAFLDFAQEPCIGGRCSRGHGLVSLTMREAGQPTPFYRSDLGEEGMPEVSVAAEELARRYRAFLAVNGDAIAEALTCV